MNNVILVGYMGCGKTTVGIRLSYRLKIPFLDTDKKIEKDHNCVISDVFATLGEETFRNWETESLVKLCKNNAAYVISTGGGMVLREENRRLLKKLGTVIYLRAKPEIFSEIAELLREGGMPQNAQLRRCLADRPSGED